jgi:TonB family protein
MILLLLKATLLFALALACLPLMRRAGSAARHLLCACTMAGVLLMPLTLLIPPSGSPIRLAPVTFLATSLTTSGAAFRSTPWLVSRVLIALWAIGVVFLLVRLAIGYWRLAAILHTAVPGDGFFVSDVSVPIVAGLVRPVILVPRSFESWGGPQRAAALRHERAHMQRYDLWTNLIAHVACALYWFHPLAWAVARSMRDEQENACDDAVLFSGFEPASYAEALIATARQITSPNLIGCHMTQKTLTSRIARLFENGLPRMSSPAALRRTALVTPVVFALVAMLNGNPQARAADDKVYKVGGDVSAPKVLSKVDPQYTDEAQAAKISGTVLLKLVIGADGVARDIAVVKSLSPDLDAKAVEAVQNWRFEPGKRNGEPVAVTANIEVNFKLK